ncbi:MAG TPA: POTRA domain-containing protein [Kofleriaceae bacterium]|nr:POTRA domain-containing protein [Kofleriaceae bacterium]
MIRALVMAMVVAVSAVARAQPATPQVEPNPASCLSVDTTPGAPMEPEPEGGALAPPIPWTEFAVDGTLIDKPATVHALLEPTMQQFRTNLSVKTLRDTISKLTAKLGYQLTGHTIEDVPSGARITLHLAPLPIVRKVDVDVSQGLFDKLLDEEIARRMRVRTGAYLPYEPFARECALVEERTRIDEYLHDEGYFGAEVKITKDLAAAGSKIHVKVSLGPEYQLAPPAIVSGNGEKLAVSDSEIRAAFKHEKICIFAVCFGTSRFSRAQHQEDLDRIRELFHKRGYPAVRVLSSFDPRISFDRATHKVRITLTIDQRRRLDVKFEGQDRDSVSDEQLRGQLTFESNGSTDDVEAQNSAHAIETYLQARGRFDAHVTWTRDRHDELDVVTFHIDQGKSREVHSVQFVGNDKQAFPDDKLADLVATKQANLSGALLGTNTSATSEKLAADQDRIKELYRRAGYREAQVSVTASTIQAGLGDAAFTAALIEAGIGDDLYVRFEIDQGAPTYLSRIELEPGDDPAAKQLAGPLCKQLIGELGSELGSALVASGEPGKCAAVAQKLLFREDDVGATKDRLRDFLFKQGRPRADLDYEARVIDAHHVEAHYKLRTIELRKIGKVVIRGNFKTRPSIIFGQLHFHEGDLLTSDALADAARKLRNTGLFNSVNIDLPDLATDSVEVNAIVRVDERYDYLSSVDVEGGYSSYNGVFGTLGWTQMNLWGTGMSFTISGTEGEKIQSVTSTIRVPTWLMRRISPIDIQTELSGLFQQQDTPGFGELTTEGATLAFTHVNNRPRTPTQDARTTSYSFHYDYRLRTRNVDALRPIGIDMDGSQVAVSTRTGSIGFTYDLEQLVDRRGQPAPLSAEDGYRVLATVSWADPVFFGQDTFIKASLSTSRVFPIGKNLVLRADFRYDEGFPLGGAVLLPDVERFFAGGDNTVRGYNDDALATEIVQFGVPPYSNVSQIRVIPAGGNIRVMGSLDAQLRIWKFFAGAIFSDAGMITNEWSTVTVDAIKPSVGTGLRALTPFGIAALEYAVPLHPELGDDPRGRIHFYFAARAQF